jgi:drug/metabolite transporter (DMT)-like permease
LKLTLVAAFLFAAFFGLVLSGQKGGDTFFSNPWLAGTITAAATSAIAGALAGLYSIVRHRERSPAVFVTTTLGLLVLAYAIAEVAFPH